MVAIAALDTIPGFSSSATSTPCSCSRGHDHPTRDNDCSNIDDYPFNVFLQPDHYWEAGFEVNMPCCTSLSSHFPEDGLHHTGIFTFPCMIVDSRMNLFDEGGNDVEI